MSELVNFLLSGNKSKLTLKAKLCDDPLFHFQHLNNLHRKSQNKLMNVAIFQKSNNVSISLENTVGTNNSYKVADCGGHKIQLVDTY